MKQGNRAFLLRKEDVEKYQEDELTSYGALMKRGEYCANGNQESWN